MHDLTLGEVLPYSLSIPITSISRQDKIWTASVLLRFFLESFTDQLVVMENKRPSGLVGGYDIINGILENPSSDFFENRIVDEIMHTEFDIVDHNTIIVELVQKWKQSRRAFSIITRNSDFSAISIRTLLGVYPFLDTALTIRDIPKKKIVYYTNEQSVRDIIILMLQNKTRRLLLQDTRSYISDRIIIEHLATNLNFLRDVNGFLDMNSSIFVPNTMKSIPDNTTIQDLCRIIYTSEHPYVSSGDQVFSPFDIVGILERDDVYAKTVMPVGLHTK